MVFEICIFVSHLKDVYAFTVKFFFILATDTKICIFVSRLKDTLDINGEIILHIDCCFQDMYIYFMPPRHSSSKWGNNYSY